MTGQPRPGRNDPGGVLVGVSGIAARHTGEEGLREAARFIDSPAGRTGAGGVTRVYKDHTDACQPRLVLDKAAQLVEGPGVYDSPLRPPNRYSLADALEVFEGDTARGVFGASHQLLGDAMIKVPLETLFTPPPLYEQSPGRLRTPALELGPQAAIAGPDVLDSSASERLSIRGRRDANNAQVHADELGDLQGWRLSRVQRYVEVEGPIPIDQIGLPLLTIKPGCLVGAEYDRDEQPPREGEKRDSLDALPRHDALVIGNGAVGPEARLDAAVPLISFYHLGDGADGKLRGKPEPPPDVVVNEFLKNEFTGAPLAKGEYPYPIAGGVEVLHSYQERGVLLGRGTELDRQRLLHGSIITQCSSI